MVILISIFQFYSWCQHNPVLLPLKLRLVACSFLCSNCISFIIHSLSRCFFVIIYASCCIRRRPSTWMNEWMNVYGKYRWSVFNERETTLMLSERTLCMTHRSYKIWMLVSILRISSILCSYLWLSIYLIRSKVTQEVNGSISVLRYRNFLL